MLLSGIDRTTVKIQGKSKDTATQVTYVITWSSFSFTALNKYYIHSAKFMEDVKKKKKRKKIF